MTRPLLARRVAACLAIGGLLAAVPAALATLANPVRNHSFEKPQLVLPQTSLFIGSGSIGWNATNVTLLSSRGGSGFPAAGGRQSLDLGNGGISQVPRSLPQAPTYTLSFEATPDYSGSCAADTGARTGEAWVRGQLAGTFQPSGSPGHVVWTHYAFTTPAPYGDISFLGTAGSRCGVIIDAVSFVANT
jgi:hypothetical protein